MQAQLDAIRDLIRVRPMISQKELAGELGISTIAISRICAQHADYIGYTVSSAEKAKRARNVVRQLIEEKPQITVDELIDKTGLSQSTIKKYIKEHPEWGWIATTHRPPESEHKTAGRKVRRNTPPVATELEIYKIQRAAEAEGYGANSYGAFLASIDYDWDGYKRRHRHGQRIT